MTTRNLLKFVVILALAFAVVGGYGVFTAKASMESFSNATHLTLPPTSSGVKTVGHAVVVSGSSGVALPVGTFVTIDGTSFRCPPPGTCTYSSVNHLQIGASATSNWALLTTLDGNFIGQGGPYLGPVGTDYSANSWSDVSASVAHGAHTIATVAFMRDAAGTAFNYDFNYQELRP